MLVPRLGSETVDSLSVSLPHQLLPMKSPALLWAALRRIPGNRGQSVASAWESVERGGPQPNSPHRTESCPHHQGTLGADPAPAEAQDDWPAPWVQLVGEPGLEDLSVQDLLGSLTHWNFEIISPCCFKLLSFWGLICYTAVDSLYTIVMCEQF